MTITEASQLVIQAGAMAEKCEVFVLNMGESIKIKDLIVKMIRLSGLSIKDDKNLDGDIEIKITGLRPGEKLYEELLISGQELSTPNDKIFKSIEKFPPDDVLQKAISDMENAIEINNIKEAKEILKKHIEGFKEV